ncbi:MAG: DUF1364 family protein [Candidatus Scalindua sp.]|nr:DUF1364 family protein [Candidatus Scalindua sp.]
MTILRKSARDRECQARLSNVCNYDKATTVLAHLNGAGIGIKQDDIFGAFVCSSCHAWLDGGYTEGDYTVECRDHEHMLAMVRTQGIWRKEGLLLIKGEKTDVDGDGFPDW